MPDGAATLIPRRETAAWPAVLSIALGTFVMVTSEFLPVGLLGSIAQEWGTSEGSTGLLLTVPGLVAAVAAPLLSVRAGQTDRRWLLILLTLSIAASDLIVAAAPNLLVALIGRVFLGIALGGVWAFAAAVGRRLVPEADGHRATALIMGGISVGTVMGVPIGTLIGSVAGWRSAFVSVAGLSLAVTIVKLFLLPALPGQPGRNLKALFGILVFRRVRLGFVAAALIACGHFCAYAYLQPFLSTEHLPAGGLTWILAGYGVAGIVGTWAGARFAERNVGGTFAAVGGLIAAAVTLAYGFSAHPFLSAALVMLWGAAFGALPVCVQIWTYEAAPEHFESGSALTVTVFQTAVASGALLGGIAVDQQGIWAAYILGALLAATAGGLLIRAKRKRYCHRGTDGQRELGPSDLDPKRPPPAGPSSIACRI